MSHIMNPMTFSSSRKKIILSLAALLTLGTIFLFPPVAQPLSFHHFADTRTLLDIPNFTNVVTNLPFVIIAIAGLRSLISSSSSNSFASSNYSLDLRITYFVLFLGVLLTGLGSAYYHYCPNNDRLVWDRIPMTVVFMSFLSALIYQLVSRTYGRLLLAPLVAIGIASVWWWHYTEQHGHGDLRLYIWVQFFPMLAVILLCSMYYAPSIRPVIRRIIWIAGWYVVAKIFEQLDEPIFRLIWIGGHGLKHLAAAASTYHFLRLSSQAGTKRP